MREIAKKAARKGFVLRSGGAVGADTAFEAGCMLVLGKSEIYFAQDATEEAMAIARNYHPVWHKLSPFAQMLHGRNAFQVLGRDLKTPSSRLICWTPDGCISHKQRSSKTGGTGTAISIASDWDIPIFNLKIQSHRKRFEEWIKK